MRRTILRKVFSNKNFLPICIFLMVSLCLFLLMNYDRVARRGPFSHHSWRQSDSYAFSLNYYYENNDFLKPSILYVGEDGHGRTASEFPVLYYLTAKIWKITGVTPFISRFLDLLILFIGLFYLYKLSFEILKDHFWAAIVSMLMFSSPLLGYYGFNFIPNIPALGFALIATYYYYKYHTSSNGYYLILSTFLFTLGALLKISSLFLFLAIYVIFFLSKILKIRQHLKAYLWHIGSCVFLFTFVIGWLLYTKDYNSKNLVGIFNQSIIPIWSITSERIHIILGTFYTNIVIYYLNPITLIALVISFITSIILFKKTNKLLLVISSILIVGVVMFLLLFFDGLDGHEYFLIDATILIPAITITFLTTLKNLSATFFSSKIAKTLAFILLLLTLDYNVVMTRAHFNPHDKLVRYNIHLPKRVMDYWNWSYWNWEIHLKKYEGIVPYIRSLGINFEDRIISIPDETPNLTLCLLNQKGFTDFRYNYYQGAKSTERKIELGAKYMIVEGEENLLREDVAPFIKNQIGEFNGIKIFRLSEK